MSTTMHVGWLNEMRRCDREGYEIAKKHFAAINRALRLAGVAEYQEPELLPGYPWWTQLSPSNGIAFLQRFAAYVTEGGPKKWPVPGDPMTMVNPLQDEMWEEASTLLGMHPFQHLSLHDPQWGYWVPVDFPDVIFPAESLRVGNQLGSSARLKVECEALAEILELPLDTDLESEEIGGGDFHWNRNKPRWKKYEVESGVLLALHRACRESLRVGAAIYVQ